MQRQINKTVSMEVGYIGRIIRNEMLPINLDSVPYMTTLGGQSFADAFSKIYFPVVAGGVPTPQPFFEAALGGTSGAYCAGFRELHGRRRFQECHRRSRTPPCPICGPRFTRLRVGRSAAAWWRSRSPAAPPARATPTC